MKQIFFILLALLSIYNNSSSQISYQVNYNVYIFNKTPIFSTPDDKSKIIKNTAKVDTFKILEVANNDFLKINQNGFVKYDKRKMKIIKETLTLYTPQGPDETYEMSPDYRRILGKQGVLPDWSATMRIDNTRDTIDISGIHQK